MSADSELFRHIHMNKKQRTRMAVRERLAAMPVAKRYIGDKDPDEGSDVARVFRVIGASRILQDADLTEPTDAQMNAAFLINLLGDENKTLYSVSDINFVAGRLDEFERIIPELIKRQVFDRGTAEMLMDANAPALMDGEL